MAIETVEKCDICAAEISKDPTRPGFPQLSWCYFRKAPGVFVNAATGEPVLQETWQGDVNRLEFCELHGHAFNVLLKAYIAKDLDLATLLGRLLVDDDSLTAARAEAAKAEHIAALKLWAETKAEEDAAIERRAAIAANRATAAASEKASKKEARATDRAKKDDGGET